MHPSQSFLHSSFAALGLEIENVRELAGKDKHTHTGKTNGLKNERKQMPKLKDNM